MYNLHCHSLLSDGVLLPSELARRFEAKGYKALAITDHVDASNIKRVVAEITEFCRKWPKGRIRVLPGIELTHIPLEQFKTLVKYARSKGIKVIIGHGETSVEPVMEGTNRAAIDSGIDILAHPGNITVEDAQLAKKKGVFLEITSRKGHSLTNKQVAEKALACGAKLIIEMDSHMPEDIITPQELFQVGLESGLTKEQVEESYRNLESFLSRI